MRHPIHFVGLLLALAGFSAIAAPLQAREVQIVPEWSVQVLDETGKPVTGFDVDEEWTFFGTELMQSGNDSRVTDAQGRVVFPAHSFKVSEAAYLADHVSSSLNVHGSFGPEGSVNIRPEKYKYIESKYDGKIYEPDVGAKTTMGKSGFATTFRLTPADIFDFMDRGGDWAAVKRILATNPAAAKSRNSQSETPLIYLVVNDLYGRNIEMAGLLLGAGAGINDQAEGGMTALHIAARNGTVAYVDFLLSKGADPNLKIEEGDVERPKGSTPLHLFLEADYEGHDVIAVAQKITCIKCLLAHGADINAKDSKGNTPLHAALNSHYCGPEIISFLLARGADPQAKNSAGQTPLASIEAREDTPEIHAVREILINVSAKTIGK